MKSYFLLFAFFSLLLFSCDEKNNNDNIIDEPLFTETNYIYEGDIRLFYLESENARLNDSIAVWNQVTINDAGYNEAQGNIAEANVEIMENQADSTNISTNFSIAAFQAGIVIPDIPPLPDPCFCLITRNSITKLVLFPDTFQSNVSIEFDNENILESNAGINDIPNLESGLKYQDINFVNQDFEGEAILTLQTNGDNPISVRVYAYNQ